MAASLVLRRGRAGPLKTVLLEARVFRGFASTASLCAESGKNEKGHSLNPKKQSPPKNVVEPKERVKPLTPQTAAAPPDSLSPPRSPLPCGSRGGTLASPHPSGSMLLSEEGPLQRFSRKTLVEFPQKVLPPFQEQGSDSKVHQVPGNQRDDSSSSSSSSSTSSSSDSESDEEGDVPEVGPQGVSKGKGRFSKPEATRPFEKKDPKATASAKENTGVQRPPMDVTYPGQPRPLKKTGPSTKSVKDRKEAKPKPTTPSSQASEEILKKNVKKEELQKIFSAHETDEESQKPFVVQDTLSGRTKAGSSTQQSGGLVFAAQTEEARARDQLPAAAPGAQGLEPQVPGPGWKASSPLAREENVGKQVTERHSKAKGGILEDQVPVRDVKKADVSGEKASGPQPEERGQADAAEDAAPCGEAQGHTQEPAQAPVPPELNDTTTYKNLQHHDYNTYTFLDLNRDLSQFRMPQPSSGRESPRH
ncbi:NADH dehydrogenase [ubiquinone] flavoprotein 3, mitochondrial isoform X1 [Marmota flaviventris]|uniref:NADH dehydrogenase [ubiquinone] flavoprotein 3, mitochondrial isoform X1 n=1 Tax=Marmota flaviventris TaxID=93162 RepID=UPI003A8644CB